MKLIYITDVHGAFEQVRSLLYETLADVYIIAGDLIDIPFYTMNTAINYHELQVFFHGLRRRMDRTDVFIEDFVDKLLDMPEVEEDILEKGAKYQQYTIRARRVLQQKYKFLENMMSLKQNSKVLCLPGNYDMDLKYTSLHERDLHLHSYEVEGLKIAGYGGADTWTPGIPERYVVRYRAGKGVPDHQNELYRFFSSVRPDIICAHQPPHGIHDHVTAMGPSGSPALRAYCDDHQVLMCLSGHIHDEWGVVEKEGTVFLNPSNFGDVTQVDGTVAEGGHFYSVEITAGRVEDIFFQKLVDGRVYDIADYHRRNGGWEEEIIDKERYSALQRRENYDAKTVKSSHIPEFVLYNEIKQFFRMFQTNEAEERIDRLEKASRLIEEGGRDNFAMDVVGSVNVGLSESGSDIDFVLYLRCGSEESDTCVSGDYCRCPRYGEVKEMLQDILGEQLKFDIVDCINLDTVERSIREKNYECEATQRFVAYRTICRPVNYRVISPLEDLLNADQEFRKEMEGSIRAYVKMFVTTAQHVRSFSKYEERLRSIGIKIPEAIKMKIRRYLQEMDEETKG
ncbi:MAG: metallophosphoesterase [Smithellaceae bacterium]|nr:metallophosphoesterase [Smithellaceae bacterium]